MYMKTLRGKAELYLPQIGFRKFHINCHLIE